MCSVNWVIIILFLTNSLLYSFFLFDLSIGIEAVNSQFGHDAIRGKSLHAISMNDEDPNIRFLCKGALGDFTACICNDLNIDAVEVACINAQFVDIAVFQHLNVYYPNARKITFHGNNFQDLPDETPLFGIVNGSPVIYESLRVLNLSANYIVNLYADALRATPNIMILDLSNNEIVLSPENVHFLDHTPHLTHLYLRRAFTSVINRTNQFNLMMKMFENAKLKHLQLIDLSYNYLTLVPYNLACPFPSIRVVDLRQNFLATIAMNTSCLSNVELVDLSRNHFQRLDENFRRNFADQLPANSIVLRNSFICDCKSIDYLQWFRNAKSIRDRNTMVCGRASPANYVGARFVEVPLHRLDCNIDLSSINSALSYCKLSYNSLLYIVVFVVFYVKKIK